MGEQERSGYAQRTASRSRDADRPWEMLMDDSPKTPDLDLPGQQHDQAPDIVVEPEPDSPRADGAAAGSSDEQEGTDASADDPALGNTLIRPENS